MSTSLRVVTVMTRKPFQDPDTTASRASFRVIAVTVPTVRFLGALWIVTDWMHVEARRSNLWILMLVFMGPVLALAAAEELVDWMRNGRRPPGRHRRDPGATHETD